MKITSLTKRHYNISTEERQPAKSENKNYYSDCFGGSLFFSHGDFFFFLDQFCCKLEKIFKIKILRKKRSILENLKN
jgi:hypothetical protein